MADSNDLKGYLDSVGLPTLAYGTYKAARALPSLGRGLLKLGTKSPAWLAASTVMDPTPANQGEVPFYVIDPVSGKYVPNPARTGAQMPPTPPAPPAAPTFADRFGAAFPGRPQTAAASPPPTPQAAQPSMIMQAAHQWLQSQQTPQPAPQAPQVPPAQPMQSLPLPPNQRPVTELPNRNLAYAQADTGPPAVPGGSPLIDKFLAMLRRNGDAAVQLQG